MRRELRTLTLGTGLLAAGIAVAQSPAEIQRGYESAARQVSPAFGGFSAQRGETFFKSAHGGDWSCASCHTQSPVATGRHAVTGKAIAPLAPAAGPARFTDAAKVEKWFNRNCNDVLKRACTPAEKGDVLAYLMSLKN
jgi:hypothetical protein